MGHGRRKDWTLTDAAWAGYDRDAHVRDLEAFLLATSVEQPIDLMGYSMGGAMAFEFAARFAWRVRSLSLFAPAMVLTPENYADTLAIRQSGAVERCKYNYRTTEEAAEMMRQVGYAEQHVPMLARVLGSLRAAYPPDYWWHMWHAFSEVPA
eukprot:5441819-Prymnesium_polylepis.1